MRSKRWFTNHIQEQFCVYTQPMRDDLYNVMSSLIGWARSPKWSLHIVFFPADVPSRHSAHVTISGRGPWSEELCGRGGAGPGWGTQRGQHIQWRAATSHSSVQVRLILWWHKDREMLSALLALCEGNPPVTGRLPSQRESNLELDVSFVVCLNKWLNRWSCSLPEWISLYVCQLADVNIKW